MSRLSNDESKVLAPSSSGAGPASVMSPRRPLLWVVVALIAAGSTVAALALTGVLHLRRDDAAPPVSKSPAPSPTVTQPVSAPSDGGLQVVEKAISRTVSYYSFGIIFKNTSHLVAETPNWKVTPLDGQGRPLAKLSARYVSAGVVLPGKKVSVGGDFASSLGAVKDLRITLDTSATHWWPMQNLGTQFAEIAVTQVKVTWPQGVAGPTLDNARETIRLTMTVRSGYATSMPDIHAARQGALNMEFRDHNGRLVGGHQFRDAPVEIPSGVSQVTEEIPVSLWPYRADRSRTEASLTN